MPEFIPQHTPDDLADMVQGYLDCAEWLLDDDERKRECRGWSQEAIAEAKEDCERFVRYNEAAINEFLETTGHGMDFVGHSFWLNRNGHGTGFWDRDAGDAGDKLSDACDDYTSRDPYVGDDGYLYFG